MSTYVHPVDPSTYQADDPFGNLRSDGRPHLGSDYAVGIGTSVRSASDGVVIVVKTLVSGELGMVVGVQGWDGVFVGYAHLSAVLVQLDQHVKAGDVIARSGNTGSRTTGAHLHISMGTTAGAIFGEGFGRTLIDPHARIVQLSTGTAGGGSVPFRQGGLPMFNLVSVPDAGLIYVVGIDGTREGVQSADHLSALVRFRNAMLTPGDPFQMYWGDLVGPHGNVQWYLQRVNGDRDAAGEPNGEPYKFTDEELAKIGQAAKLDVDALLKAIAKLDDAEHKQILDAINRPRTVQ